MSSVGLGVSEPQPAWDLTALECLSVLVPSVAKLAECSIMLPGFQRLFRRLGRLSALA